MNVRLIKTGMLPSGKKQEPPPVEAAIIDTIRTWVREFQSTRADRARLDFERMSNPGRT